MVDFVIPCTTFRRLVHASLQPTDNDKRDWLRCIRFEAHKGAFIAVASYGHILVAEKINNDMGDDMAICVTISPEFLAFVDRGITNDDSLIVTPAPGWTVARLAGGAIFPGSVEWAGSDQWPVWRDLLPVDMPKKALAPMAFTGSHIDRMAKASPSGTFACQKYAEAEQPVIVRDINDPLWLGLFKVDRTGPGQAFEFATVPDWVR